MMRRTLYVFGAIVLVAAAALVGTYVVARASLLDSLHARSTVVDTSAGPIEYRLTGTQGPVLLFLHGTPGGYDQAPASQPGSRLLAVSRPGYLRTPLSVGDTPAAQADAIVALLDVLDIDAVVVMGASGGGPAAYAFAHRHPERTVALIAIEAVSHAWEPENVALFESDFGFWLLLSGLSLVMDDAGLVGMMVPDETERAHILADPQVASEVAGLMWSLWPPSQRAAGTSNDFEQFRNLDIALADIRVPTLIVHGTADRSVPFEHAEHAARQIPGARLHAIQEAGHMMPFTHAAEIDQVVGTFVRDAVGRSRSPT